MTTRLPTVAEQRECIGYIIAGLDTVIAREQGALRQTAIDLRAEWQAALAALGASKSGATTDDTNPAIPSL